MPTPVNAQVIRDVNRNNNFFGGAAFGQIAQGLMNPFLSGVGTAAGRWLGNKISPDPQVQFQKDQSRRADAEMMRTETPYYQRLYGMTGDINQVQAEARARGLTDEQIALLTPEMLEGNPNAQQTGRNYQAVQEASGAGGNPFSQQYQPPSGVAAGASTAATTGAAQAPAPQAPPEGTGTPDAGLYSSYDSTFEKDRGDELGPGAKDPLKSSLSARVQGPEPELPPPSASKVVDPGKPEVRAQIRAAATSAVQEQNKKDYESGRDDPTSPHFVPPKTREEYERWVKPPLNQDQQERLDGVLSLSDMAPDKRAALNKEVTISAKMVNYTRRLLAGEDVNPQKLLEAGNMTAAQIDKTIQGFIYENPQLQELAMAPYMTGENILNYTAYVSPGSDKDPNQMERAKAFKQFLDDMPEEDRPLVKHIFARMKELTGLNFQTAATAFTAKHQVSQGYTSLEQSGALNKAQIANLAERTNLTKEQVSVFAERSRAEIDNLIATTGSVLSQTSYQQAVTRNVNIEATLKRNMAPLDARLKVLKYDADKAALHLAAGQQIQDQIGALENMQLKMVSEDPATGMPLTPEQIAAARNSKQYRDATTSIMELRQQAAFERRAYAKYSQNYEQRTGGRSLFTDIQDASRQVEEELTMTQGRDSAYFESAKRTGWSATMNEDAVTVAPDGTLRYNNTKVEGVYIPPEQGALFAKYGRDLYLKDPRFATTFPSLEDFRRMDSGRKNEVYDAAQGGMRKVPVSIGSLYSGVKSRALWTHARNSWKAARESYPTIVRSEVLPSAQPEEAPAPAQQPARPAAPAGQTPQQEPAKPSKRMEGLLKRDPSTLTYNERLEVNAYKREQSKKEWEGKRGEMDIPKTPSPGYYRQDY